MWKDILNRYQTRPTSPITSTPIESECIHKEIEEENDQQICIDCGEIIGRKIIISSNFIVNGLARKKITASAIYSCIPSYVVDDKIKNLAVNIYKIVSANRQYRTSFRKAIIAACVHRASIVCNPIPLSIATCVEIFNIKSFSEMERAMIFVAENIPYGEYKIPIRIHTIHDLQSILVEFNLLDKMEFITNLISKLEIESFFHQRSSLCASIWFTITLNNSSNISLRTFTCQYNNLCIKGLKKTTCCTIRKRFLEIKRFVYRRTLKRVFANYLYKHIGHNISKTVENDIIATNLHNSDEMTIIATDGFEYPIDDVDDITDWNILFNKQWIGTEIKGPPIHIPYVVKDTGKRISIETDTGDNTGDNIGDNIEKIMINEIYYFIGQRTTTV